MISDKLPQLVLFLFNSLHLGANGKEVKVENHTKIIGKLGKGRIGIIALHFIRRCKLFFLAARTASTRCIGKGGETEDHTLLCNYSSRSFAQRLCTDQASIASGCERIL